MHLVLKVMRNHFDQILFMEPVTEATAIPLLWGCTAEFSKSI